jgi:hypothetical protein
MNTRLSTIRSIGHRDRAPSVAAQETGQPYQTQEAKKSPFAGVVLPRHCLRGWRLHSLPWGRSWGGRAWRRLRQHYRGRHDRHNDRQEYDHSQYCLLAG